MSDVSAVTHLLPRANEGFISTLGSSISSGAAVVPLTNVTGLVNGSTFVGIIEAGQIKQQVFTGIVDTGAGAITGVVWTRGSNVPHSGGVSIVDYITGTAINMLSKAFGVEHNDNGTHSNITATSISTGTLTVGGKDVSQLTPTGLINAFAGSSSPAGWLLCDGSAVSRATYAALYAVVGNIYGPGDGTTTFNIPNLKGKTVFGVDTAESEFASLGTIGGQKDMIAHSHGINDGGHAHGVNQWSHNHSIGTLGSSGSYGLKDGAASSSGTGFTSTVTSGVSIQASGANVSVQSAGSGANNLNPYISLNYIIKT